MIVIELGAHLSRSADGSRARNIGDALLRAQRAGQRLHLRQGRYRHVPPVRPQAMTTTTAASQREPVEIRDLAAQHLRPGWEAGMTPDSAPAPVCRTEFTLDLTR